MSEVLSAALKALEARKEEAARLGRVNDADLPAGSPMHYYCRLCGLLAETLPELHERAPKPYCDACQTAIDAGSLDGSGLEALKRVKSPCAMCGGRGNGPGGGRCWNCGGDGVTVKVENAKL